MEPNDSVLRRWLPLAGSAAGVVSAFTALTRFAMDEPTGVSMLIAFLTGCAGALWAAFFFMLYRWLAWTRTLNTYWPLSRVVMFFCEAQTEDNLECLLRLVSVHLGPTPVKLAHVNILSLSVEGVSLPVRGAVVASALGPALVRTTSYEVAFSVVNRMHPPAATRGHVQFTVTLERGGSPTETITYDIDFEIPPAQPGPRQVTA